MENRKISGETSLRPKYGLPTAIAMVTGIVIGSGVFFKAEKILDATGGNLPLGILAWGIGGAVMVLCAYAFSILASQLVHVSGLVDYAEDALGARYGYAVGWFQIAIYYPSMAGVVAWLCARYICVLTNTDITGGTCMLFSLLFLVGSYTVNVLAPLLAGRVQVVTATLKLVPLIVMAVVGTIQGLRSGMTIENFTTIVTEIPVGEGLFAAVTASAFAYEGWIVAASINAELKNPRRNLPIALIAGTVTVAVVYILYYIGLAGGVPNQVMMENGETGARLAFEAVFSRWGGTLLFVFIVISCMGTLNGLMLASVRGLYSLAVRGRGPAPHIFREVDTATGVPANSGVFGLLMSALWLVYFYGAVLDGGWFGVFSFDSSELPVMTLYAFYIPILAKITRHPSLPVWKRFFIPVAAIGGCIFMIVAGCISHGLSLVYYLLVCAAIMGIGFLFSA